MSIYGLAGEEIYFQLARISQPHSYLPGPTLNPPSVLVIPAVFAGIPARPKGRRRRVWDQKAVKVSETSLFRIHLFNSLEAKRGLKTRFLRIRAPR
jgi:hypothetical protein